PFFPAAAPRMDDEGCPPRQNWTEGQEGTLRCRARGNPRPEVACAKDGEPFPPGVPRPVTRAHAGTYRCRAANALGAASRDVTVAVNCEWGLGGPGGPKGLGVLGGSGGLGGL
ncbi:ICAM5 protein, partial [Caloenas nicobarica]|nr:ICAM5 protein [Caloenas nicobarica]